MSRVLCIPDSHLKTSVIERGMELANRLDADKIILLGDYFDDWNAIPPEYVQMIECLEKALKDERVIPLVGNHELSYLGFPCSGHLREVEFEVKDWLLNEKRLRFVYSEDGVLYSHAGVTSSWLAENRITEANNVDEVSKAIDNLPHIRQFATAGRMRGGNGTPSPLWADLTELIQDPIPIRQVVGHTPISGIERIGNEYFECWFTDVYSNGNISDEYLFVEDGEPKIIHYVKEI